MAGGIYLIQQEGGLTELADQPYDSEALLQELLAKYPQLLGGDTGSSGAERRWLLISREYGVPDEEGASGRWSVDHLFLDQEGVPTLVEVKRSQDTRIRREVVGQMLDYAANAVVYWPAELIRAGFEARCQIDGLDPTQELLELLGQDAEVESFWQAVKTHLRAGRVRMVFVADEIPPELRRVVEFLNGQMDPAEVLALEVRQYIGDGGLRALVPSVVGRTAEAERKKTITAQRPASDLMQAYQIFFTDLLTAFKAAMPGVTSASKVSPARAFWFSFGAVGGRAVLRSERRPDAADRRDFCRPASHRRAPLVP